MLAACSGHGYTDFNKYNTISDIESPVKSQIAPFPQNILPQDTLNNFYPLILGEIQNALSLQNDERTLRGTLEYGYSFFKMEKGDFTYTAVPDFLRILGNEICESLNHSPQQFTNVIISVYAEGFHLEPHIDINADHTDHGYYFDDNVYGIIIEADETGALYFVYHDDPANIPPLNLNPIYTLHEQPGMVFCLQGDYRKAPYCHGVSRVSKRRLSITFRNVIIRNEGLIPAIIHTEDNFQLTSSLSNL